MNQGKTERARQLRKESTAPERLLWSKLRGPEVEGVRWRRQYVIGDYIVDFCCRRAKVVVELDGRSHIDQRDHDDARQAFIESQGYLVIRFSNDEVLRNLHQVALSLHEVAQSRIKPW